MAAGGVIGREEQPSALAAFFERVAGRAETSTPRG
jgi:hypothetical protein